MRRHAAIRRIGCKTGRKAWYGVDIHEGDAIEEQTGSWQPVSGDEAACPECNPLLAKAEERGFWPDWWKYSKLVNDVLVCFHWESRHSAGEPGDHCEQKRST